MSEQEKNLYDLPSSAKDTVYNEQMQNEVEKMQLEKKQEYCSDYNLEYVITDINNFKKFYESAFVKDTSMEEYGFSEQEQKQMLELAEKLKEKILDEYENNEKLLVSGHSQFSHLFKNFLTLIGGYAKRYDRGKLVSERTKKDIKEKVELLNYYIQELIENKELMKDEITHEDGYLQKFAKYLKKERISNNLWIILLLKFFRDLETKGIYKNDFYNRLLEMNEKVIIDGKPAIIEDSLDIQKLEQDLVKEGDSEIYKYVLKN